MDMTSRRQRTQTQSINTILCVTHSLIIVMCSICTIDYSSFLLTVYKLLFATDYMLKTEGVQNVFYFVNANVIVWKNDNEN